MGITASFDTCSAYVHLPCKAPGLPSFWSEEKLRMRWQSKTLPPCKPGVPACHDAGIAAAGWFRGGSSCLTELEQTLRSTEDPAVCRKASIFFFTVLYNHILELGELSTTDSKGLVELPLGLALSQMVLSLCCYCLVTICCVCTQLSTRTCAQALCNPLAFV